MTDILDLNVMLDLETWGTRPGCDLRSIGAVVFDAARNYVAIPNGDENNDTKSFYVATHNPTTKVNYQYCDGCGTEWMGGEQPIYSLHRDPGTVEWWSKQSPESQAAFENPVELKEALQQFSDWLKQISPDPANIKIWANDPHFDVSILSEAYYAVGLPIPWHYRSPRSMRTIVDLAGLAREGYVSYGVFQNALDDAIAQALTVCKCYERLGLLK